MKQIQSNPQDVIEIVDYDPIWDSKFFEEAERLREVLPKSIPYVLEHIGSTSIPEQAAKPIIDIAIACDSQDQWAAFRVPIESLGYVFWADNPDSEDMFFVKGMPPYGERRTHHIHIRRSDYVKKLVGFRDLLRQDYDLRRRYAELKRGLAVRFQNDREAYTEEKTNFIQEVLRSGNVA